MVAMVRVPFFAAVVAAAGASETSGNLRGQTAGNSTAVDPATALWRRPRNSWNTSDFHILSLGRSYGSRCESHRSPRDSKCAGCPPMKDGKLCASTTWYEDTTRGSCGCGGRGHVDDDFWTLTEYTAAMNCASMSDDPSKSWCPLKCGECYELCTTGGSTQGREPTPGVCRVFKITNRCGDGYDDNHPDWCSQHMSWQSCAGNPEKCRQQGSTNQFGYPAHFDLQDYHLQITGHLNWDNAEVTFEKVSCSRWTGPSDAACEGCDGH